MTEFKIKVIKQNRILLSILVFAVLFPFCLLLSAKLDLIFFKIAVPIVIVAVITTLLYYFSFGRIKIKVVDRKLSFKWKRKPIFNFKEYHTILLDDITEIVVGQGLFLTKIKTRDAQVELGGRRSKNEDSRRLLKLLKSETSAKILDEWDVWKQRGWLTMAYKINLVILLISIGFVIAFITLRGFNSKLLLFMPLVLSQLALGHLKMKSKLGKN